MSIKVSSKKYYISQLNINKYSKKKESAIPSQSLHSIMVCGLAPCIGYKKPKTHKKRHGKLRA